MSNSQPINPDPSMSLKESYVTGIALSQFVHGAAALGVDTDDLLTSVGLDSEALSPTSRVPEAKYEMLILRLLATTQNPNLGTDIGRQVILPLYGVLMSLALGSPSLGEAIHYLARYQGLATGSCGELHYEPDGELYRLRMSMSHRNPVIRRVVSECVITFFTCLPKFITGGKDITPKGITLAHGPYSPAAKRYFERQINCPVEWGAPEYQILLSAQQHALPIYGHGEQMLRLTEELAQAQLETVNAQQTVFDQVIWHIEAQMQTTAPRREDIARRLNMSLRTFDRRLERAGTSWQDLLDHTRLKRSLALLGQRDMTVVSIAKHLGFADVRSFQRKFKSWTGMSPSAYRQGG